MSGIFELKQHLYTVISNIYILLSQLKKIRLCNHALYKVKFSIIYILTFFKLLSNYII